MFSKTSSIILLLAMLLTPSNAIDKEELKGSWHLRIMDGKEVRKARAILDFDLDKMTVSGFDACNRISGKLEKTSRTHYRASMLKTTKMACREYIHLWVRSRLHKTLKKGFTIKEGRQKETEGIILENSRHKLFFKKMGEEKSWFPSVSKLKKVFN